MVSIRECMDRICDKGKVSLGCKMCCNSPTCSVIFVIYNNHYHYFDELLICVHLCKYVRNICNMCKIEGILY